MVQTQAQHDWQEILFYLIPAFAIVADDNVGKIGVPQCVSLF